MFRAIPGDPASIYISGRLSPEDIEALRKSFGLDLPLYLQYLKYMSNFFTGDFGMSFSFREPVMDILVPRFFNTVILMGPTMLMSIVMGSYIGANLGWKRGTKRERIGVIMSLFFRSFPIYLSGIISLMLFSHLLGIFPLGGMRTIGLFGLSEFQKFIDVTHHLILPLTVATLYFLGDIVVISRTAMLELIGEEFLLFAKAKGLGESKIKKSPEEM